MNRKQIAEQAYKTAVRNEHIVHDINATVCHAISEIGEAYNAYKERNIDVLECVKYFYDCGTPSEYTSFYERNFKGCMAEELADIFLVVSGLAEHLEIDMTNTENVNVKLCNHDIPALLNATTRSILEAFLCTRREYAAPRVSRVLDHIEQIAETLKVDLAFHIKAKMKYNEVKK